MSKPLTRTAYCAALTVGFLVCLALLLSCTSIGGGTETVRHARTVQPATTATPNDGGWIMQPYTTARPGHICDASIVCQ